MKLYINKQIVLFFILGIGIFPRLIIATDVIKISSPALLPLLVLKSPRATVTTYLHSMNNVKQGETKQIKKAVATFDLSEVNALVRQERGKI